MADTITPEITARARLWVTTVIPETNIITKASVMGIFRRIRKLDHSKVPITTINITPVNAASGILSIRELAKRMKASRNSPAAIPESRPRPPERILMMLCPIIAQPPIPPKNPVTTLATPCPRHSRVLLPRVSVNSSIRVSVIKDSINPTAARMKEKGAIKYRVSQSIGIEKEIRLGNEPPIEAISRTTSVSRSRPITIKLTVPIAASEEGN